MGCENRLFTSRQLPALTEATLLPDVVDDHRDEASFLWTQWELALRSPRTSLREVETGVESRMCAHVSALALSASVAHDRLLADAQESAEPGDLFATALAFLACGGAAAEAAVDLLRGAQGDARAAAVRAFELAGAAALPESASSGARRLAEDDDPELRALASRLLPGAAGASRGPHEPASRERRLERGFVLRALEATPDDLAHLAQAALSGDPEAAPAALFALGFSRAPAAWDACVRALTAGPHGAVAADSMAALAGVSLFALDLARAPLLPGATGEPADDELRLTPESLLAVPDVPRVAAWWSSRGRALALARAESRALDGVIADLLEGSMWRHAGWALELARLAQGAATLDPWDFAREQRRTLERLAADRRPRPGARNAPDRQ